MRIRICWSHAIFWRISCKFIYDNHMRIIGESHANQYMIITCEISENLMQLSMIIEDCQYGFAWDSPIFLFYISPMIITEVWQSSETSVRIYHAILLSGLSRTFSCENHGRDNMINFRKGTQKPLQKTLQRNHKHTRLETWLNRTRWPSQIKNPKI